MCSLHEWERTDINNTSVSDEALNCPDRYHLSFGAFVGVRPSKDGYGFCPLAGAI